MENENINNNLPESNTLGDLNQDNQPSVQGAPLLPETQGTDLTPTIDGSAPLIAPAINERSKVMTESKFRSFLGKIFENKKKVIIYLLVILFLSAFVVSIVLWVKTKNDLKEQKAITKEQEITISDQKMTIDNQLNCTVCPEVAPVAAETPAATPPTTTTKTYPSTSSQESVTLPPPPPAD